MHNPDVKPERRRPVVTQPELIDNNHHMFAVLTADTYALQEQAYRLRYQVYCVENPYENPLEHPDGLEIDEFDARSVHSVVMDRPSQDMTGTVRIILPDPESFGTSFPIQKVCHHPMLSGQHVALAPRCAEISRFAVSKELSRRSADTHPHLRHSDFANPKRISVPHITLGLLHGVVQMSVEHGIEELFAVMEPTLLRLLGRFGIYFSPIGPMVDYHGLRQPCHANMQTLLDRVLKERVDVWEIITDHGKLQQHGGEAHTPRRQAN
jgi:N-acyl amino acid synthase of PEP-CTERM/exosortase system